MVEKTFAHLKPRLEPSSPDLKAKTRARLFLAIPGYTMVAIIAGVCGITYNKAMETLAGIKEVVYSTGSHPHVEYTKDQRQLQESLKLEL